MPPISKSKKQQQEPVPPRPVAYQFNPDPQKALDPKDLVMAYEENGRVMPVVSDFDCFLVGTRRVAFRHALPPEQMKMMNWCVDTIENVLDEVKAKPSTEKATWTGEWLENLKKERTENNFKPTVPKYGYADPKSYAIMSHAVHYLQDNGSVRHGAECFNYYFPQELDEYFLVVSYDIRIGGNRWDTFKEDELLGFLSQKVRDGFMFPLNPKWILCDDPGWKSLYDKQIRSTNPAVQKCVDAWYPPSSGVRERLEQVHAKHPNGFIEQMGQSSGHGLPVRRQTSFVMRNGWTLGDVEEDMGMDYALMQLDHHEKVQKAKVVFQVIIAANRLRKMAERRKQLEAMTVAVRGGSLVKGSLPPRKNVLRVRVPREALPNGLRQKNGLTERSNSSNSFSIASLASKVPLLRSLSFDHWSPSKKRKPVSTLPEKPVANKTTRSQQPARTTSHDSVNPRPRNNNNLNLNLSTPTKQPIQRIQRHTASKTRYY